VADDIISDGLCLGVQLHDRLVDDIILRLHIRLLLVHSARLLLCLLQRVLEHDFLLIELFLLSFELLHARCQELDLLSALVELVMQVFGRLLLFLCLVSDTADF
jgi:hypothetical protein